MPRRNGLAFGRRFLGHRLLEILKRAPVTAGFRRYEAPCAGRKGCRHLERHRPDEQANGQHKAVFEPLADIEQHKSRLG